MIEVKALILLAERLRYCRCSSLLEVKVLRDETWFLEALSHTKCSN